MAITQNRLCLLPVFALSIAPVRAQMLSPYEHVMEALKAVEDYKYSPEHINGSAANEFGHDSSQILTPQNMVHYLTAKESEKFTEKNGTITYSSWDGGLALRYDYDLLFHAWPFLLKDVTKKWPTGNTKYQVTQQGFTIIIYNDVQYRCDPKKPGFEDAYPCPYTTFLGCKSGSRVEDVTFTIEGLGTKVCKANVSCQHTKTQLIAGYGGGGLKWNQAKGVYHNMGAVGGNPYSPWKYTHTMTIQVPFDSMAKAAGMSRKELMKLLVTRGFKNITTAAIENWWNNYDRAPLRWRPGLNGKMPTKKDRMASQLDPLSNILCYKFLKESGYTLEILKEEHNLAIAKREEERRAKGRGEYDEHLQYTVNYLKKTQEVFNGNAGEREKMERDIMCYDLAEAYLRKCMNIARDIYDTARYKHAMTSFLYCKYMKTVNLYQLKRRYKINRKEADAEIRFFRDSVPMVSIASYELYHALAEEDARYNDYDQAIRRIKGIIAADDKGSTEEEHEIMSSYQQDWAQYHFLRASLFHKDKERAYADCKEALSGRFADLDTLEQLGLMILQTGTQHKEESQQLAVGVWKKILEIDPNYPERKTPLSKKMKNLK